MQILEMHGISNRGRTEALLYSFFQKKSFQDSTLDLGAPEGFLPSEQFEAQLLIERARADRAGSRFCMLTLRIDAAIDANEYVVAERVLAHVLVKSSRNIDTKGAFRGGLAIIMPYTPSDKAELVSRKIQDSYKRRVMADLGEAKAVPELRCEIYAYPSKELATQAG